MSHLPESRPRLPSKQASLEPLPPKWLVVQAENGQWTHPSTGVKYQFMLIDEGSRFRVARILKNEGDGCAKSQQMIRVYHPSRLRVNPEGAWRSRALEGYFKKQHVELIRIPAEAHWQISHVERAIQCAKAVMTKLATDDPEVSATEALAEAIWTANEKEIVRGYTPAQHVLGKAPDDSTGPDQKSFQKSLENILLESSKEIGEECRLRRRPLWTGPTLSD